MTTTTKQDQAQADAKVAGPVNWMLLMMEAVQKDQNSMANMQLTDAQSTELGVKIETAIYAFWYENKSIPGTVAYWTQKIEDAKKSTDIQKDQAEYSTASADAQKNTSQQDGVVQEQQQQTSTDASNLAMKAQMIQPINQLISALAAMTDRITA